jgi:hypothetical protein
MYNKISNIDLKFKKYFIKKIEKKHLLINKINKFNKLINNFIK